MTLSEIQVAPEETLPPTREAVITARDLRKSYKNFEAVKGIDQTEKFEGNTVLRGGQQPRVDKDSMIIR